MGHGPGVLRPPLDVENAELINTNLTPEDEQKLRDAFAEEHEYAVGAH